MEFVEPKRSINIMTFKNFGNFLQTTPVLGVDINILVNNFVPLLKLLCTLFAVGKRCLLIAVRLRFAVQNFIDIEIFVLRTYLFVL